VFFPAFPCKQNAKYAEWKIILDRVLATVPVDSEITFVGHSLGGNFIIKYLAETDVSDRKVSAVHLVAACYGDGSFSEPADEGWERLSRCADAVHIWQAKDDMIVPVALSEHIRGKLPGAEYHLFETGGHFRIAEFAELEGEIIS
jgi:predicted alpha/beta hydrolase family esterase